MSFSMATHLCNLHRPVYAEILGHICTCMYRSGFYTSFALSRNHEFLPRIHSDLKSITESDTDFKKMKVVHIFRSITLKIVTFLYKTSEPASTFLWKELCQNHFPSPKLRRGNASEIQKDLLKFLSLKFQYPLINNE